MTIKDEAQKEIKFSDYNNKSLTKYYNDLNKAVASNNVQSIWQLSKIITRYRLKFVDHKNKKSH
ncbi:MAG: hypothetical protein ACFE8A_06615 [Candidatus Hodarchaeota archaeon]